MGSRGEGRERRKGGRRYDCKKEEETRGKERRREKGDEERRNVGGEVSRERKAGKQWK